MDLHIAKQKFSQIKTRLNAYEYAQSLSDWDMKTLSPIKGKDRAAELGGILAGEAFDIYSSPETRKVLEVLSSSDQLNIVEKREVELLLDDCEKMDRIPKDEFQRYCVLTAKATTAWEEARENNDYHAFEPYLSEIVDYKRKYAKWTMPEKHPYEALLDDYEKGLTISEVDEVFTAIRSAIPPLLRKIQQEGREIRRDFLAREFPAEGQKRISSIIMKELGFDMDAGVLAESEHPFTTGITVNDVRITTKYHANNFTSALYSTIHETGHAIYEQRSHKNIDLNESMLLGGVSLGIHESQSRFYENILGRSRGFMDYIFPILQSEFPNQLSDVTAEELYRAVNIAEPSLIRIEADELTYNLHIYIRYELEKQLMEGNIEVKQLPKLWNEKYEEYLGITPDTNATGILQDTHWAMGSIGYFPTYTLGNVYSAQFLNTMEKEIDVSKACSAGKFDVITNWLGEKIHQYGRLKKPYELVQDVCGESLSPKYIIEYLNKKYEDVYFKG